MHDDAKYNCAVEHVFSSSEIGVTFCLALRRDFFRNDIEFISERECQVLAAYLKNTGWIFYTDWAEGWSTIPDNSKMIHNIGGKTFEDRRKLSTPPRNDYFLLIKINLDVKRGMLQVSRVCV